MNFRTSYLVGLTAAFFALSSPFVTLPAQGQNLKVTGPDGQSREQPRQYGPTTPRDTFWSIANQVRPDNSVSIYQVMAAIYEANPHAFTSKNYNSLEKGMILLIPSKEVMLAIPRSLAQQRAEQDDHAWQQQTAPATVKPSKPKAKKVEQAVETAAATPVVAVDAKQTPAANSAVAALDVDNLQTTNLNLTDELSRAKDQLLAADDEKKLLQSQIAELQQRVTVLEESLKAARVEVAKLQNDLAAKQTADAATDASPAENKDATDVVSAQAEAETPTPAKEHAAAVAKEDNAAQPQPIAEEPLVISGAP
ncbi:hypothetical protein KHX94_01090 [Shewanella dokdonensis]|uniref:Uncharacterized protein n=1 Tax=Shewanella dokdonensis TaxID=712036 RepID=A0ABX8DHY6_9GAMM|nr:FimV/HubP family polar landmark protein [Shewanella dokdonensis]QVK23422.1 hypothetical protein KHX94_01090 [Shewanella dokdonensis]